MRGGSSMQIVIMNTKMTTGSGLTSENLVGLTLALLSSFFIGSSFILKKKGLIRAGASGIRAGVGGYSYLTEPLWWVGMITMIVGEIANFVAYAYAAAILVTPLGALSIIVSAVLAHVMLNEKLHKLGVLGCVICVVGSIVIALHAPQERSIESVKQVWKLAIQPAFLLYAASVVAIALVLIFHFAPRWGHTQVMIFVGICSLMGSLSVMSVKALGIAVKLTFEGQNQFFYLETWLFVMVVTTCVLTQMVYLNKDWDGQSASNVVSEICGFITIISGTVLLHSTKESSDTRRSLSFVSAMSPSLSGRLINGTIDSVKRIEEDSELPSATIPLCRHELFPQ
ncbi:hypothetical protein KP509_38G016500 [Ceratopteris richardii]|uniref:Probable magnesium transporter n=1 Tax=Ceratopteris richardii TaxID=49495 RepID=A0A8T2Q2Q5_CERRI|nr:hypothetical protein KP509_38G016500 [Ceratopteris richardii]